MKVTVSMPGELVVIGAMYTPRQMKYMYMYQCNILVPKFRIAYYAAGLVYMFPISNTI